MVWFFRAIETGDGAWTCRRGRVVLDEHSTLDLAMIHFRELADASPPAVLYAHWLDGRVEQVAEVSATSQ